MVAFLLWSIDRLLDAGARRRSGSACVPGCCARRSGPSCWVRHRPRAEPCRGPPGAGTTAWPACLLPVAWYLPDYLGSGSPSGPGRASRCWGPLTQPDRARGPSQVATTCPSFVLVGALLGWRRPAGVEPRPHRLRCSGWSLSGRLDPRRRPHGRRPVAPPGVSLRAATYAVMAVLSGVGWMWCSAAWSGAASRPTPARALLSPVRLAGCRVTAASSALCGSASSRRRGRRAALPGRAGAGSPGSGRRGRWTGGGARLWSDLDQHVPGAVRRVGPARTHPGRLEPAGSRGPTRRPMSAPCCRRRTVKMHRWLRCLSTSSATGSVRARSAAGRRGASGSPPTAAERPHELPPSGAVAGGLRLRRRHAGHDAADAALPDLPRAVPLLPVHRHDHFRDLCVRRHRGPAAVRQRLRQRSVAGRCCPGWRSRPVRGRVPGRARRRRCCCVGRFLSGLSAGIFTGTATVAVVELAPPAPGIAATLLATVANIGGLGCGPLLAGLLAEYVGLPLRLPFVVDLAPAGARRRGGAGRCRSRSRNARAVSRFSVQRPTVPPEVRARVRPRRHRGLRRLRGPGLVHRGRAVVPRRDPRREQPRRGRRGRLRGLRGVHPRASSRSSGSPGAGLAAGCAGLVAGMAVLALGLALDSLVLLVLGGVIAGFGQGLSFRAGLAAVSGSSPPSTGRRSPRPSSWWPTWRSQCRSSESACWPG